jgi:hypothetical protein
MKAIPIAKFSQQSSNKPLWTGISRANTRHRL